jgi:hypothetical protein
MVYLKAILNFSDLHFIYLSQVLRRLILLSFRFYTISTSLDNTSIDRRTRKQGRVDAQDANASAESGEKEDTSSR